MRDQRALVTVAAIFMAFGLAGAAINCDHGMETQGNPLGTCACDGHLWVAPNCTEGFFCYDTQANGCHIVRARLENSVAKRVMKAYMQVGRGRKGIPPSGKTPDPPRLSE